MTGRIFDIKEFSVHDGPGARVTVFMKGCRMRCLWCHNPEGQSTEKEIMHKLSQCDGCGLCTKDNRTPYPRDPGACPRGLITLCGEDVTEEDLAERLLRYAPRLERMGGGVTFSGGDPIVQAEFVARVSRRLRDSGVHTAAETSLCGSAEEAVLLAENTDLMIVDLKLADSALHERYTGMPNGMILDNIRLLKERGTCILFRTPLIPGITDGAENLRTLAEIAGGHPWEKLAYNRLAGAKYAMLGRKFDEKGEIGAI